MNQGINKRTVTEFKTLSGRKSLDGFYFVEPETK